MFVLLILLFPTLLSAGTFPFRVALTSEVVAELELVSAGSDWSVRGREGAVVRLRVDGKIEHHAVIFGPEVHYRIFLGRLEPGRHRLEIDRHPQLSAAESPLEIKSVRFQYVTMKEPLWTVVAHAPILYGRAGATEAFSDVPMLMYCERLPAVNGSYDLQYTIIFSNEDGGTSTRALMARWGRTTDIEYVYRVRLNAEGKVERATFQGKDHKELDYAGPRDGDHPFLLVSTLNNMVVDQGESPVRYQLAPTLYDLASSSREKTMDDRPILYRIASEEMQREGKLRPYGTVDGQKISDPRNYAIVEARIARQSARVAFLFRVKGQPEVFRSDLGRVDYAIDRDGWVRSATELPPGTTADQLEAVSAECVGEAGKPGRCTVEGGARVFLLDYEYYPRSVTGLRSTGVRLEASQSAAIAER